MRGQAPMEPLLFGTTSAGKLRELRRLIEPLGIACRSLADEPRAVAVEETGSSFAENAALKASAQATACGSWVLAEDSGLCVAALGNAPGVRSARFAGEPADDAANNALLLQRLAGCGDRRAHYACHAALARPDGTIIATSRGECHGMIATTPSGAGGFGYDPLFIVAEYHCTFGTLPPAVKDLISHRARAIRAILADLVRHLSGPPGGRR
jgi:XTP/dITP diphosphohydrolase